MNEQIKIIFVDIDWTILDHNTHDFDYESLEALNQAQKNGYIVFICTARPYESVSLTGLLNYIHPDGIICTNGAVAFFQDKLLFSDNFPKEVVRKVIEVSNKHNFTLELSAEKERFFTRPKNKYVDAFFSIFAEVEPPIREYNDENISAILLFSPPEYDEELLKEYPEGIKLYRFMEAACDVHLKPSSKEEGIRRVLEYFHFSKEQAMGIGDDIGDIPMFNIVGLGVAMGNGKEEAKAASKFVTKPINEHGLKYALEYFNIV